MFLSRIGLRLSFALGLITLGATAANAEDCKSKIPDGDLIKAGSLTMSTNPTLPPLQFVDSAGTLKGMRIELGAEIAKRLCLKADYVKIEFDAMIPGSAGRPLGHDQYRHLFHAGARQVDVHDPL